MSITGYSPEKLVQAAGLVEQAGQEIEGLRKGVAAKVQELLGAARQINPRDVGWGGDAAERYRLAMQDWDLQAKNILDSLERIFDNLNISAGQYRKAADDNMNLNVGANTNAVNDLINRPVPAA
ncbi:WXG100 family type VII secretion target [Nonomuraea sediminis]|uniref:WXG100 family type VII secretion target n=1 Tax=Nonomuraea sediminis TaxID=2835864 RepID=UPI001BDD8B34|nr:WXG100 family type VII secretion target [Nonomuraea sediminis]